MVNTYKYLGINFTNSFIFKDHLETIKGKTEKYLNFLKKLPISQIPMRLRVELLYVYYLSSAMFGLEPLFMEDVNLNGLETYYNKVVKETLKINKRGQD